MKKRSLSLYYITLGVICQVALCSVGVVAQAEEPQPTPNQSSGQSSSQSTDQPASQSASKPTEAELATIKSNCADIKSKLRDLQHQDSRLRVSLGDSYEDIRSNFIVPLNMRLVENNLAGPKLIQNQSDFMIARSQFIDDYIAYQKSLEDLVGTDCEADPAKFYERLTSARTRRKRVADDTAVIRKLITREQELVTTLKGEL